VIGPFYGFDWTLPILHRGAMAGHWSVLWIRLDAGYGYSTYDSPAFDWPTLATDAAARERWFPQPRYPCNIAYVPLSAVSEHKMRSLRRQNTPPTMAYTDGVRSHTMSCASGSFQRYVTALLSEASPATKRTGLTSVAQLNAQSATAMPKMLLAAKTYTINSTNHIDWSTEVAHSSGATSVRNYFW
jgi:hypothetical protein